MGLDDIWDATCDGFEYVFSFDWFGDFWEFITAGFEDIGEFSVYGIIFGVLALGMTYLMKSYTVDPFLESMGGGEKLMWMIVTYAGVFIGGYLLGKMFENTG